jgi:hypothetical protein
VQRVAPWLGLAVLLHVPLAPLVDLSPLARFFPRQPESVVPAPSAEIPVELVDDAAEPATPTVGANEPTSSGSPPSPLADEAEAIGAPAPPLAKKRRRANHRRPATSAVVVAQIPVSRSSERSASIETIADPIAALGDLKLPSTQSSLRLLLHVERVRGHMLAAHVGSLLRDVEQWRRLFEEGALDPTRDVERLLLVSSSVRDSRSFVSIFDYNVPRFRVRQAVVSDGSHAATFPSPSTLVISPPGARPSLDSLPRAFRLPAPSADELLLLHVEEPARTLSGLPSTFPSSLRWARLQATLTPDGGARVALLGRDASPAAAAHSAQILTATLGTNVVAEGDRLRATLELTPEALPAMLLSVLAALGSSPSLRGADGGSLGGAQQARRSSSLGPH